MKTYVLTAFRPCFHDTASRLRRSVLGECHCGLMGRPRFVLCAVRATSPQDASAMLGSPMRVVGSAMPTFPPSLDTATYYMFRPSPETYGIVAQAYYSLRQPARPRAPGSPTLRETIRSLRSPEAALDSGKLDSLMELAGAERRDDLETALRAALVDKRLEYYLMVVPEVPFVEAESPHSIPE